MVKPATDRAVKYKTKIANTAPMTYQAMKEYMEGKADVVGKRAEIDNAVAGILARHNIVAQQRIPYYNFARWLEKRVRENNLSDMLLQAGKEFFKAQGATDEEVLDEIVKLFTGQETL